MVMVNMVMVFVGIMMIQFVGLGCGDMMLEIGMMLVVLEMSEVVVVILIVMIKKGVISKTGDVCLFLLISSYLFVMLQDVA